MLSNWFESWTLGANLDAQINEIKAPKPEHVPLKIRKKTEL